MTKLKLTYKETIVGAVDPILYDLSEIENIENGQLKDFYSYPDIYGNGSKPQDSCIKINFKDTMTATFGKDWVISFE